jgi:hypothetical protein
MSDDTRFHTYLRSRAEALDVRPVESGAVVARAAHRRQRRVVVGVVIVVLVLAAGVTRLAGRGTTVEAGGMPPAAAPGLDWRPVDVPSVLGAEASTVVGPGGTLFALVKGGLVGEPTDEKALYRSADGQAWGPLPLPPGLTVRSLVADADRVYVVGTVTAGASTEVMVGASTDGSNWSMTPVPTPRASLVARHPDMVKVVVDTATAGPHGLTVAVSVRADLSSEDLYSHGLPPVNRVLATPDGLEVYGVPAAGGAGCDASPGTTPGIGPSGTTPGTTPGTMPGAMPEPVLCEVRPWGDLGVDPELRDLMTGELHVHVSTDGASSFEELATLPHLSALPSRIFDTSSGWTVAAGVAEARPLGSPYKSYEPTSFHSPDGHSWTNAGPVPISYAYGGGLLDGRPAMAGYGPDTLDFWLATADATGHWTGTAIAPGRAGAIVNSGTVAFGPLGYTAITGLVGPARDEIDRYIIVTSPDGRSFHTRPMRELVTDGVWEAGDVVATPDAVLIRIWRPLEEAGGRLGQPKVQRLLIGTR